MRRRLRQTALLMAVFLLAGCAGSQSEASPPSPAVQPSSLPAPSEPAPPVPEPEPVTLTTVDELAWLPVEGATGYAPVAMPLLQSADADSPALLSLLPGDAFLILAEQEGWWHVRFGETAGWVQSEVCFINLPDVVPSVLYDITNTYSSRFVSSGREIPNITRQALYSARGYNSRLGREEFVVPVLYSMAKKVYEAQKAALAEGSSLKIYEAYRPYEAQQAVVRELGALAGQDAEVMAGLNTPPWGMNWFIATSVSNHQVGYAIDLSLVRVEALAFEEVGGYAVPRAEIYTEYEMPTAIHELSMAAVTFTAPVAALHETAWQQATPAPTMNEAALLLQRYCTDAGMTPLASEWWHFNDLAAWEATRENPSRGGYLLETCLSVVPEG